ncbi:MAG: DNA polymerase I [Candidatus Buchananbacteria bacterium RIFCSPHIGHO2_02_FULL_40_13]|uniref:DNA polymerase I n=1 Tax=Candidatus Buchananbacteria bacterium RIFCSPLOWO2_01_FULL_39_33 TaxID=1797543 RepID=A0A1G1YLC2_9BACT|nr:MAG: DNA polymerase I [Candidatus Buchananbacteria bacterium RIFCSPHIGHO2_02_FULL_40_13]OGY52480.1 MAG: DNA polymerase I [Candidatus Buchananbacteria bacterium RIFCSPLOWO2_01_FULL_39_33]
MKTEKQKLVIIDANALVHRAFHALPPLTTKDGVLVNAVYGFTAILLKVLKDLRPDYIAAAFDVKAKTFRHQEFEAYKATRVKAPDELYQQIPLVKEVLKSFNVTIFEQAGYEADDLIGTIAHLKSVDRPEIETIIVTGDQDTFQLVDNNTKIFSPHKGLGETILYDEQVIKEKFNGLKPEQLIDYKALRGDPSDNIPGVKGIGEKGAINLLNDFKTLENIYQHLDSKKISERHQKLLKEHEKEAFLSKKLATIITEVPIKFDLENCRLGGFDKTKVIKLFQELNFKRLMTQLANLDSKLQIKSGQGGLFDDVQKHKNTENLPTGRQAQKQNYILVNNEKILKDFLTNLKKQEEFCFDSETTGLDPFSAKLLGLSFCWQKNQAYYLPINAIAQIKNDLLLIFKNPKIKKIGHNIKYDLAVLKESGVEVKGIYFDTMVASYLLNPGNRQHNLDTLAFIELGYQMQPISDLIGTGQKQINMSEVPLEKLSWYSGEDADLTFQLYQKLKKDLENEGMFGLFEELEMPLIEVLADIEKNGVKLDLKLLNKLSQETNQDLELLEKKIYKAVGKKFNIASPQQLKEILFEKLKISTVGLGKTKTGISTAADELEKLRGEHQVIDLILDFRELAKLKSTYLDALPKLINTKDHRVHTSFNQTVTATGRLSSSNPNLQNIPIRTKRGQQIRKIFIAEKDYKIVKADYSQIELRIVASLANDKNMLSAFESQVDIHTKTAAAINDLKIEEVTPSLRRQAKEINFGVLYGMGSWGLSKRTGISSQEAKKFIDKYFQTYQEVKKYLLETIEIARTKGYVETFYGRRRYLPEINSSSQPVRAGAERMAINMPIQGTAADLIKLAMIQIHQKLPKVSPATKMILQVHDELVFEVPAKEVKKVAEFIKNAMNDVYKLRAPIATETSAGSSWGETQEL